MVSREERSTSSGVVSRRATLNRWRRRAFSPHAHILTCTRDKHIYLKKSTMICQAITSNYYWKLCIILVAVAGGTKGWKIGSGHKYRLTNTLIFREAEPPKSGGDVGYRLTGDLDITAVWQDSNDPSIFLLKFEVCHLQIYHFQNRTIADRNLFDKILCHWKYRINFIVI